MQAFHRKISKQEKRVIIMKNSKHYFNRLICVALVPILCVTLIVSVFALTYKGSVQLKANERSVTSGQYSGHWGNVRAYNNSGSAGSVTAELQLSSGGGWKTYASVSVAPGKSDETKAWGQNGVSYLYRTILSASNPPLLGNPGCIASASIYTDSSN